MLQLNRYAVGKKRNDDDDDEIDETDDGSSIFSTILVFNYVIPAFTSR